MVLTYLFSVILCLTLSTYNFRLGLGTCSFSLNGSQIIESLRGEHLFFFGLFLGGHSKFYFILFWFPLYFEELNWEL